VAESDVLARGGELKGHKVGRVWEGAVPSAPSQEKNDF